VNHFKLMTMFMVMVIQSKNAGQEWEEAAVVAA
jgi:hypothetical protein